MRLEMLGKKRREDRTYYAAYTATGQLIELTLMDDVSPAVVGKLNAALHDVVASAREVQIDTNDIKRIAAVKWT